MPELSTAPADAALAGTEKLLTLAFESVSVQQVADANESKSADIASAATTDIGAATASFVHVTGTTTITSLGTAQAGAERVVRFAGALTLTHHATSLILPTGANITTAANDVAVFRSEGAGNWRCVGYQRASGEALVGAGASLNLAVTALSIASGVVNIDLSLGNLFTLALTANVTSITFSNAPGAGFGRSIEIRMQQDGTGSRTVALPASFKATGGSDTAVASAANAYTVLSATTFDAGTRWEYAMQEGGA